MRRWWWILLGLGVLGVGAVWLDPTRVLWGLLHGETFYRGRPTSFWVRQMQAAAAEQEAWLRNAASGQPMQPSWPEQLMTGLGFSSQPREFLQGDDSDLAALPLLDELLRHPDPTVRHAAVLNLSAIHLDHPAALPYLVNALQDSDQRVRSEAVGIIFNHAPEVVQDNPAMVPLLIEVLEHHPDSTWAVRAMKRYGPGARAGVPVLLRVLADPAQRPRTGKNVPTCYVPSIPKPPTALDFRDSPDNNWRFCDRESGGR